MQTRCINYTGYAPGLNLRGEAAPEAWMESPPPSTLSPPPPWLTNTNYTLRGYTHGLFCDIYIRNGVFLVNMRQKLITLDPTSWDLAAKKPNFSQWVRDQLRSERNKRESKTIVCRYCSKTYPKTDFYDHKCVTVGQLPEWEEE